MNRREQQLLDELGDRFSCRTCGAVHYPSVWMAKTRERLVASGVLEQVSCKVLDEINVALRIK